MALRAKQPEHIEKRLKLFVYGPAGSGKTTAAIQFPQSYVIDTERGAENYDDLIRESGSVVWQTTDCFEVIKEVQSLRAETHPYRTIVLDPITPLYSELLDESEKKVGSDFGRHYGEANKHMKRLVNLLMNLDMNVIITAHAKNEYGEGMVTVGQTFDGWKKLDYIFDLVLELQQRGDKRVAIVKKTRLADFPMRDVFEWNYQEFQKRFGKDRLEREAETVAFASQEQVADLSRMLESLNLPEGTADKWLAKANATSFSEMTADQVAACISYCHKKLKGD